MDLLVYFALPVATIILAVVFQKIIKSPILVALTAFAIYLIVTFTAFDASFLINAIVYTILAYIAASITQFIIRALKGNWTIGNLNAENINTDTLNTNELNVNDDTDDNNGNCNRSYRQFYNRNFR